MLLAALCALAAAAPARADDEMLRGPHPFLKDNELSVHGGFGAGLGDSFAGPKGTVDYGYKLDGGLWLDLGVGFLSGTCRPRVEGDDCGRKGDQAEVLAGIKYKLRMNVPVVPYAKAVVGLAYLFPDETKAALGPVARAGIGANYFFYDWLGVGAEVLAGVGHAGYVSGAPLDDTIGSIDFALGVELQF